MNKHDLVKAVKNENGLKNAEAEAVVDLFFDEIASALANGNRAEIRGFCSFKVKDYQAYKGRNPKTGARVEIKPKKLPFFKCSNALKERVDP